MRGHAVLLAIVLGATGPAAGAQTVDDFAFMAGNWIEERAEGTVVRETWTGTDGGWLIGLSKTVRPGRPAAFEYMRVGPTPEGLAYIAQPGGAAPTTFLLKSLEGGEAVFENAGHDFPQRVIYRSCDGDLCARIEGTVGGKLESESWRYRRAR